MNIAGIEALLRDRTGLWTEAVGRGQLRRAVEKRMARLGFAQVAAYEEHAIATPAEFQALVELVVVPETWFFRDDRPFTLATELAAARREAGRLVRLLSLPCATGAEPYSLAIGLLGARFTPAQFQIDAADISAEALAIARRGVYGEGVFRSRELAWREQWFRKHTDGWHIDARAKAVVNFREGNVFTMTLPAGHPGYDFVFCRNLLIYFEAAGQHTAVDCVLSLLAPDGVLFVGHAEAAIALRAGLRPWPAQRGFAFTRADEHAEPVKPKPVRLPKVAAVVAPARPAALPARAGATPRATPELTPRVPAPVADLREAERLADGGQLARAEDVVRAFLETHGPSAQAFYLLGVAADAKDDAHGAEAFYRKALYLEPTHLGALAHLAPSLEKTGRRGEAERVRQRLRRLAVAGGKA